MLRSSISCGGFLNKVRTVTVQVTMKPATYIVASLIGTAKIQRVACDFGNDVTVDV